MIFEKFDEIRIINLASRTDRKAEMIAELGRFNLAGDARVAFFEACTFDDAGAFFYSRGARGVYHSHLAVLEQAAARNHSVLILEDDCDFGPAVEAFELPDQWDIFYGGYYASSEDLHRSDIIGAHCMGFTAETAKRLVDYLKTLLEVGNHPGIDGAYVWFRRGHPRLKTVFAVPPIAEQRPSRTDIGEMSIFDRLPGLGGALTVARRLKRWGRRR